MITKIQLLFLFVYTAAVYARSWTSSQLPSPQQDSSGVCGRGVKSSICDPDGFISPSDADTIDGFINFIHEGSHGFKKVPCKGSERGAQIAVAVIESMGPGSGVKESRAFQFARALHDKWGIGDSECQNGVVLFFAVKDHAMGISTGAGIKSIFKDSMIPSVMAIVRPNLKQGEYGKAIIDGVVAIGNILSSGKVPDVVNAEDYGPPVAFIVAILAIGGACLLDSRKRRRYANCKKLLEQIDKDRDAANKNQYIATSCPICLDDFEDVSKPEEESQTDLETGPVRTVRTGGSMSSTNTATTERADDKERILRCGHKFHEKCILSWISGKGASNQRCPICRQLITIEGADHVTEMTNDGLPSGWDVFDLEYSFRLRRARYFYSDFITWNMINSWEAGQYRYSHPLATSSVFVAIDPAVVAAAARSSGGGGSSFSFGGGSSFGGGGGGGSW